MYNVIILHIVNIRFHLAHNPEGNIIFRKKHSLEKELTAQAPTLSYNALGSYKKPF